MKLGLGGVDRAWAQEVQEHIIRHLHIDRERSDARLNSSHVPRVTVLLVERLALNPKTNRSNNGCAPRGASTRGGPWA